MSSYFCVCVCTLAKLPDIRNAKGAHNPWERWEGFWVGGCLVGWIGAGLSV